MAINKTKGIIKPGRALTLTAIWLLNPVFGGCDSQEFEFGESEMIALMESINEQAWSHEDGASSYEIQFSLSQGQGAQARIQLSDFLASAKACGERSFVASAEACIDESNLHVQGHVTIVDAETQEKVVEDLSVDGLMYVYGLKLDNASLRLEMENGEIQFDSSDGLAFDLEALSWD